MLFCADRKFDYPKSVCNLGDGCFTPGIFGHAIRMKDDTVEIPLSSRLVPSNSGENFTANRAAGFRPVSSCIFRIRGAVAIGVLSRFVCRNIRFDSTRNFCNVVRICLDL
jgi:hypothetical protein